MEPNRIKVSEHPGLTAQILIFEETGELIPLEELMRCRCASCADAYDFGQE